MDRAARDPHLASCLHRVARGDAAAFEAFHDATHVLARGFTRRYLTGADADDLLAEVYFEVWRTAPRFDASRGSAVTWLLTLVKSRAIDALRLRKTQPSVGGSASGARGDGSQGADAPDPAEDIPDDEPDPVELLWRGQMDARLQAALPSLGAAERWVLGLAYFRELSHAQIAAATGMPLGTVKSLIHRAQQRLRVQLLGTS